MLVDQLLDQQEFKKKQEKLFEQQKKFRNLEVDKKIFAEETINLIKKQKMNIDKLKKENQTLKELIAKVNNEKNHQSKLSQNSQAFKEFLAEITKAIQDQKQTQKNIDTHISNFQKKIIQNKKRRLGMNSEADSQNNLQKQIKILENRLDKANQKFNQTIAINKELKNVIQSLRKQRVIFDNLYKKLENQLQEKRKKMADIIEKANNAYQDRDKANNHINSLKFQAKKEALDFQKEIKEISHVLQNIKLSSYAKKNIRHLQEQSFNLPEAEETNTTQPKFIKQTKKSTEQSEKIQKFRQDFAKIEAATQIDNFDELLRIFSKNEEKNFQMFKFVNLQSHQIEQLQSQVAQLKEEQEKESLGGSTNTSQKTKYLSQMQINLGFLQSQLKDIEIKYANTQKEAKSIIGLVQRIFDTIECDRELAKEISSSKTISETNLLVFLAVIEHKGVQIMQAYMRVSSLNQKYALQQKKEGQSYPAILTFQDFDDNEQYQKILTRQQLKQKANDFINKQKNQKQKKKEKIAKKR